MGIYAWIASMYFRIFCFIFPLLSQGSKDLSSKRGKWVTSKSRLFYCFLLACQFLISGCFTLAQAKWQDCVDRFKGLRESSALLDPWVERKTWVPREVGDLLENGTLTNGQWALVEGEGKKGQSSWMVGTLGRYSMGPDYGINVLIDAKGEPFLFLIQGARRFIQI